eukprot:CAMPEP_0204312040 /NCGR_PEP_ID=MMETSP0469-20131031/2729_1 /ASSEMBLY_ACC=CAM_ASM_000384 /TAXON_ID=2969 /ORGANISM="Oxyrrhis marina" /LENGTH=558 /DNA_ID=CAMNT_0051292107 /DNA_START=1 /DNA_END=1677 /DNA_ORIENTATION=-
MREQQMREQQMREQQMREQQMREEQVRGQFAAGQEAQLTTLYQQEHERDQAERAQRLREQEQRAQEERDLRRQADSTPDQQRRDTARFGAPPRQQDEEIITAPQRGTNVKLLQERQLQQLHGLAAGAEAVATEDQDSVLYPQSEDGSVRIACDEQSQDGLATEQCVVTDGVAPPVEPAQGRRLGAAPEPIRVPRPKTEAVEQRLAKLAQASADRDTPQRRISTRAEQSRRSGEGASAAAQPPAAEARRSGMLAAGRQGESTASLRGAETRPDPPPARRRYSNPHLEAMACAVEDINERALREVRQLKSPLPTVQAILSAVAVLIGNDDVTWVGLRKMLQHMAPFVQRLRDVDPHAVTLMQFKRLKKMIAAPEFATESVKGSFPVIHRLAVFCRSCVAFLSESRFADVAKAPAKAAPRTPVVATDMSLKFSPNVRKLSDDELSKVVDLQISRPNVASIMFHGTTDCRGINFDKIVRLQVGEVLLYEECGNKPPPGEGLNKRSTVTMYQCWPPNGADSLQDPKSQDRYRRKIQQMTEKKNAHFIDYDCITGVWQFQVDHF